MPETVEFTGNFMFLNLAQRYTPTLMPDELYLAARQAWRLAACRREKVQYVAIVRQGEIKEVYEVQNWFPTIIPRFEGTPVTGALRQRYLNKSAAPYMPAGAPFVVSYNFPCK
jgi:hypothetical protein